MRGCGRSALATIASAVVAAGRLPLLLLLGVLLLLRALLRLSLGLPCSHVCCCRCSPSRLLAGSTGSGRCGAQAPPAV